MDAVQEGERTPVQSKRRRLAHHRHRAQSIIQFQSLDQLEDEVTHGYYETTPTRQGSRKRVILIEILNGLLWWICFGQLSCLLHSNSPLSLWQQFSLIVLILIFTVSFTCLSILKRACLSHFGLLFLRVSSILILVSDWFYLPLVGGVIGGVACFLSLMSGLWNLSILDK
ncbi:PREDICTED: uncharacterized protein LOC109590143 [Amphimedon queenslandica]|nr:PREDICTED: uncharacterized protein LOC109590143 [Amphimedon queenslandica]|eukprot:XP_019861631.1 PREDICTED: uncharacterized protein LOC109590143 [Amphimedon queenslandica]